MSTGRLSRPDTASVRSSTRSADGRSRPTAGRAAGRSAPSRPASTSAASTSNASSDLASSDLASGGGGEPVDLRLAVGVAAAWLAILCCLHRSAATSLWLAAAGAGLGATLIGLRTCRGRRWAAATALAGFCVALALVPLAGRIAHARASPVTALAREHAQVVLVLTLDSDPTPLAARGPGGAARIAVTASAESVATRGTNTPADSDVLVLADGPAWTGLQPGQRVRVDGTLSPDRDGGVLSVTVFARSAPELIGTPPWWQRAAGDVRSALRAACAGLPDAERGLLPGLVVGDTRDLDPVLAQRFRLAGLTHLVAVSGTNCSIVVGAVVLLLRRARARPWLIAVGGIVVLIMFVVVARPTPSVLRAAVMGTIALAAFAAGRHRAAVPALAAATLSLLLWDPSLAASASFAMSVLATAALLVIAPGWARRLRARRVPPGVAEAVAVAAAAHLVTIPVVAAISGQVSLVAIAANVLAEPVVAATTMLGFGAALVAPGWLGGGAALAWLAGWPCRWLVAVAEFFGGLDGAAIPWPGGTVGALALALLLAGLALAAGLGARRVLGAAATTALVIFIPVRSVTSSWPPSGWLFAACDVGQGDALLLNAGAGSAVEIDAGPDPVPIDRCLREFGIDTLPLVVLTHFHLDHVGGLPGALRGREVKRIVSGPLYEPAAGVAIVRRLAVARHLALTTPTPGSRLTAGNVQLDVLGPAGAFHGTRSDPNNSSLVLLARVHGTRILLPGDAEIEAQRALLDANVDLRADVLKVPHHGSAYSDPAFLAAAHAHLAVISVGRHNDYGHPSPLLLRELAQLGVPVLRTDRDGDIAVTATDGRVAAVVNAVPSGVVPVGLGRRSPVRPAGHAMGRAVIAPTLSAPGGWMVSWQRVWSGRTTSRARSPAWCCSSETRNCSSIGRSARSPPLRGGRTPTSPSRC